MIAWALWWRRSAVAWSVAQIMLSAVPLLSFSLEILSIVFAALGAVAASVPLASLALMGIGSLSAAPPGMADAPRMRRAAGAMRLRRLARTVAPALRVAVAMCASVAVCCAAADTMRSSVHGLIALSAAASVTSSSSSHSESTAHVSAAMITAAVSVVLLVAPACACAAPMVPYDDHAMASDPLAIAESFEYAGEEEDERVGKDPGDGHDIYDERSATAGCKRGDLAACEYVAKQRMKRAAERKTQQWS
jgi:hypothetical protein